MAVRAANDKVGSGCRRGLNDGLGNTTVVGEHIAVGVHLMRPEPRNRVEHAGAFRCQIAFVDHHHGHVVGRLKEGQAVSNCPTSLFGVLPGDDNLAGFELALAGGGDENWTT